MQIIFSKLARRKALQAWLKRLVKEKQPTRVIKMENPIWRELFAGITLWKFSTQVVYLMYLTGKKFLCKEINSYLLMSGFVLLVTKVTRWHGVSTPTQKSVNE